MFLVINRLKSMVEIKIDRKIKNPSVWFLYEYKNKDFIFMWVFSKNIVILCFSRAGNVNHNITMTGPAGTGKSMLAKRMSTILPDMTFDEILEVTKLHSIAGTLQADTPIITQRPFRSPHHTVSSNALSDKFLDNTSNISFHKF